jgi:hypothetical protein
MGSEYSDSDKQSLLLRAEAGDTSAQCQLGAIYATGDFGKIDLLASVKWYRTATELGSSEAQYNLGLMYLNGQGVERSIDVGMELLLKAASSTDSDAKYAEELLGSIYETGAFGFQRDPHRALGWYRRAATHGNPKAQYALGLMYLSGDVTQGDPQVGQQLIRKAAQGGCQDAIAYLRQKDSSLTKGVTLELCALL